MRLPQLPRFMYRRGHDIGQFQIRFRPAGPSDKIGWWSSVWEYKEAESADWIHGQQPMVWVEITKEDFSLTRYGARLSWEGFIAWERRERWKKGLRPRLRKSYTLNV